MLRVGLTGGIACGKSHVLRRLAEAGLPTLDLDAVAHEVTAPGGSAHAEVLSGFGPRILAPDGSIDRKALGAIVFSDRTARAHLNAIVHPRVRAEEARRAAAHAGDPSGVFVTDAALLVESGVHLRFDRLVVVHCSPEEQLRRLIARDGLSEGAARARIDSQMPIVEKRRFAHFDVDTTGSVEDTQRAADELAGRLRAAALALPEREPVPRARALACLLGGPAAGPRGLTPGGLLREIAAAGGLEMERIARTLRPPCEDPWYRCARPSEGPPGPETLGGPLVLWAMVRGGPDPEFLVHAAASLARLTHTEPASIAAACLFALALQDAAVGGGLEQLPRRLPTWRARIERWAGSSLPYWLPAMLEAVAKGGGAEGDVALAGALIGLARGGAARDAPPELVAALDALDALGALPSV
jgi:dephospho-CoA kinase